VTATARLGAFLPTRPHPAFAGWGIVFVSALANLVSGPAQTWGVGLFIDPMIAEFGWSRSHLSTAYGLATLVSALTVLGIGRAVDRLGARRMLAAAGVLCAAGMLVLSVATSIAVVFVGFALIRSFGSGSLTLIGRALVPQWFITRRGLAFSLFGLGGIVGLAVVPPASTWLIDAHGWRIAWRIEAIVILALFVPLVVALVRDRPEAIGQIPDGGRAARPDRRGRVRIPPADTERTFREAIRTRAFWMLLWVGMVPATVMTAMSFHLVSILQESGVSSASIASVFVLEAALTLPASFLCGWLVDRTSFRVPLTISAVLSVGMAITIAIAGSVWMAIAYGVCRGLANGMFGVAFDVAWPSYFGRQRLGQMRGVSSAVMTVGAAIAPIPVGVLYDRSGSYTTAMWVMVALPVSAVVAALLTTRPKDPVPA
jgi:MFS family permease